MKQKICNYWLLSENQADEPKYEQNVMARHMESFQ